jgi:hypothetical protein
MHRGVPHGEIFFLAASKSEGKCTFRGIEGGQLSVLNSQGIRVFMIPDQLIRIIEYI